MTDVVVRPFRLRIVAYAVAVLTVGSFGLIAWALGRAVGELQFGPVDQVLMTGVGVALAAVALGLARARVTADGERIQVRNGFREREFPWALVRAVRLDDGAPWATLELQDQETVALFAVQASDGARAARAVQELRARLEQSRRPR